MDKYLPLLTLALLLLAAAPGNAKIFSQCPGGSFSDLNGDGVIRADEGEIVNPESPREVCIHLAAGDGFINMADKLLDPDGDGMGHLQYIFGFKNVTGVPDDQVMATAMLGMEFSAPTIKVKQGDELYLSLSNVGMVMRPDLFDPHTVHWHGFPNASSVFDGEPMASISINMGSTLTYWYNVAEPGTYMYHCHVEATEHMQMGMLGNLYVTPSQDGTPKTFDGRTFSKFAYNDGDGSTGYDVDYPIQITAFDPFFHDQHVAVQPLPFALMDDKYPMLNGRGYPDTINPAALPNAFNGNLSQKINARVTALQGQRVLLRISSLSTVSFHTLTIQGLPMQVVGMGAKKLDRYYTTNSITLGGGESVDVIIDTRGVRRGTYFLYTTNLDQLSNNEEDYGGMMTEITIL
jgi:FtsP/CotA-like multicopper oxidase with cupredoxin domain